MRIEKRSGGDERTILTAMIVDNSVCGRVAAKWPRELGSGLFASKYANIVAGWCVNFYNTYGTAPGAAVEGLYHSWAEGGADPETAGLVETLLAGLSGDYEAAAAGVNSAHVIDVAGRHFNRVRVQTFLNNTQAELDNGRADEASKILDSWGRVELGGTYGVDIFNDENAVFTAFENRAKPLITWPGALGEFMQSGVVFAPDCLVSFIAPEKRGKTWWLMEVAWLGVMARKRVAMFQVGDMSQAQMITRFGVRAARHPLFPGVVRVPTKFEREKEDDKSPQVLDYKERSFEEGITYQAAQQGLRNAWAKTRSDNTLFKLFTYPNDTISALGIRTEIMNLEREGWLPDIIVIDYADILAPISGTADSRDQINSTWKRLRALSQETHSCVVTATQADAASYSVGTLTRGNFNNDKRVNAHCTAIIGINQTPDEKDAGVQRLNFTVLREGYFSETKCVHVAGSLGIGRPAVLSSW